LIRHGKSKAAPLLQSAAPSRIESLYISHAVLPKTCVPAETPRSVVLDLEQCRAAPHPRAQPKPDAGTGRMNPPLGAISTIPMCSLSTMSIRGRSRAPLGTTQPAPAGSMILRQFR
jgi:hypothetical protein